MMYHVRMTIATAGRVMRQLSHDPRTLVLIFVVPCLLLGLLRWLFEDATATFDHLAPALLGVFPFILMFIITSITTLRERVGGTLERLMSMPIGKLDVMLGYMLAFGVVAIVQALLASTLLLYGFNLDVAGPDWLLIVMALADALLGTALGLLVSAFARTEFQAVQFMPAFVLPQFLISGLFVPLAAMPDVLEKIAYCLPMTYAVDALNEVSKHTDITSNAVRDFWVVIGCIIVATTLGALTLQRKSR